MQYYLEVRAFLLLCGVLEAIISAGYLIGQDTDGLLNFHAWHGRVMLLGWLMIAAGVCAIAAGIWNSRSSKSLPGWLFVLNGVASAALGGIFVFWTGPLAFRTVALLIVVMAASLGVYELAAGREWLIRGAGVISVGFALAFLGFVFRWIKLNPASPAQSLDWLASYFGFSAICMLGLALWPKLQSFL